MDLQGQKNFHYSLLLIKATMSNGWHIYSATQKGGGPQPTIFQFAQSKDYELVGKLIEPKPLVKYEKVFEMNVYYFSNTVLFSQKIKLRAKQTKVKVNVSFMACTDSQCLPPKEVSLSIPVT
ncbi:hypothetical protein ABIE26_000211 [Pedobacter africanus]|uniref:Uncharacterized protein n=1 Tax=Pedobacter africanus TaxID=151894 RepID=A0ACC6KW46_9SPHI|nr:protein-disulfide reductase DsbD domain-containing protein [Pedobacter africanus]MDR6783301.1 hypothetical protein [Pedobacter africanus]